VNEHFVRHSGEKSIMTEVTFSGQRRDPTKIIIIFGFLLVLIWQATLLYAVPRFISVWNILDPGSNQHLPRLFRFFFGNAFIRWFIFLITSALLIYFTRQKQIRFLPGSLTLSLMFALTLLMHVSLYMATFMLVNLS
jgi:hypothetical protein